MNTISVDAPTGPSARISPSLVVWVVQECRAVRNIVDNPNDHTAR